MPSMFSRRRASSQPPQHSAPPSSSAAIAASTAFLQKSTSSASLSSAAAAAALRSHTTSPEPIGNIQTKRMVRRGSQTSVGSGSVMGAPRGGAGSRQMVRRDSNSSMTERTFRSPSPGRPASRSDAVSPGPDAPPVPAIPASIPKAGKRRSASLEPPARITSPTPTAGKRNTSADRSGFNSSPRQSKKSDLPDLPELEREDSQRSVNFSRPMSPSQAPPRPHSSIGWFTSPVVSNGTPRTNPSAARPQSSIEFSSPEMQRVQQEVQDAANKPVKKKKKKATVVGHEGAKLANGTMNTGPQGTAVAPLDFVPYQSPEQAARTPTQPAPAEATPVKKKKKTKVVPPVDTQVLEEPFQSPIRPSPSTSDGSRNPGSPRAPGALHKQPSVVREDPEAEASAEHDFTPSKKSLSKSLGLKDTGKTVTTSEGPVKSYIAPGGKSRERAVSLDIPREMTGGQRRSSGSVSPSRRVHAHFAEGSMVATPLNIRHQPPPRSVSPMKSALRQSPASSVRTSSPNVGANGTRAPASDASDTTSLTSQDGIKPAKKKKSVRISFEDGVVAVSPSSDPNARRELSGSWSDDVNEIMKPRPALPSFGSVRGRKGPVQSAEVPEKVTETVPSSMSTSASTLPDRQEISNDHAVGAVIANDYARKVEAAETQKPEPAAPELLAPATTVYASDVSDSVYSEDETDKETPTLVQREEVPPRDEQLPSSFEIERAAQSAAEPQAVEPIVPDIMLQPATPGVEEEAQPSLVLPPVEGKRFSMPGGWDEGDEHRNTAASGQIKRDGMSDTETESSEDETDLQPAPVAMERHSPQLQPIFESEPDSDSDSDSESDSDDSAAFSDAAEDLSELDDHGFVSLDAIVESPAHQPSPRPAIPTPPDSPTHQLSAPKMATSQPSPLSSEPFAPANSDWGQATTYWSSLSKKKKAEMEAEAREAEASAAVADAEPKPKKKRPAQMDIMNPDSFAPPSPVASPAVPLAPEEQPDSRFPTMRKSMRQPAEPVPAGNETHMRKSMRSGGSEGSMRGGSMRSTMRGGDATARPKKAVQQAPPSNTTGTDLTASALAAASSQTQAAQKPTKPVIAPLPAYDSDSESSFKKKRRGSVSTVDSMGKYTMKRSMRSGSVDSGQPQRAISPTPAPARPDTGRLSLRSLSPPGSSMGRNRENIRTSLRSAPVDDAPTMRGKNSRAARDSKSSSGFSMSGFSKAKASPAPTTKSRSSGFRSRFADSDDEDDVGPSSGGGFRSRFADSDDEDSPIGPPKHMPADLTPVRGIPRGRNQDSDSTDLSDSDDERQTRKRGAERVSKKPMVPSQSDIDVAMEIAKRNVAAMNGGREPGVPPPPPEPTGTVRSAPAIPMTPTRRKGFLGSVLRRNSSSTVAASPANASSLATVKSPKLQRRNTPQNWPLPTTTNGANGHEARPVTSDGPPHMKKSMRPDLGRRSMSGGDLKAIADGNAYSERTGKKKKFSRLRRVFGLND